MTSLCSSTVKKSSPSKRSRSQNQKSHELFPPPPPEFLHDHSIIDTEKQLNIQATGPGLRDGLTDDHCLYTFVLILIEENSYCLKSKVTLI